MMVWDPGSESGGRAISVFDFRRASSLADFCFDYQTLDLQCTDVELQRSPALFLACIRGRRIGKLCDRDRISAEGESFGNERTQLTRARIRSPSRQDYWVPSVP